MSERPIDGYLRKIINAIYGREVRQAIHDAINQCYEDVSEIDSTMSSTSEHAVRNSTLYAEFAKKYEKPSTGIPKGDLSQAVQDALDALQGVSLVTDNSFSTTSENAVQNKVITARINQIQSDIDDLNYKPIVVSSLSVTPNQAEIGSTVSSVSLAWGLNKAAESATLDGTTITLSGTSGTISKTGLSLTSNKAWTLAVTDDRSATASKATTLSFLNRVYYGKASIPANVNSAFLLSLSGDLTSSKAKTFSANPGTDEYIWYAVPARFGDCIFNVGGFDGGFRLISTFNHTNASGYTESYKVYRSDNAALGQTAVTVR